jgi:hypothetical protein
MCFDHDPETHKFRGWICQNCNTAIGKLGDNLAGLMAAIRYLQLATNANRNPSESLLEMQGTKSKRVIPQKQE